ncbi:hypothetical protein ACLMJK_003927 [Lecanora helva]
MGTEACAQFGDNDINWVHTCELVKWDHARRAPSDLVEVEGLALKIKKHQLVAAYWMLKMETAGCKEGTEADEMGYGRVCEKASNWKSLSRQGTGHEEEHVWKYIRRRDGTITWVPHIGRDG